LKLIVSTVVFGTLFEIEILKVAFSEEFWEIDVMLKLFEVRLKYGLLEDAVIKTLLTGQLPEFRIGNVI
jgi:hypothetical protein